MEYETSTSIDATPARVWAVLTDVGHWTEWIDSYQEVTRLDAGPLGPGSRTRVKQRGLAAGEWTVTELTEGERFAWENRQPGVTTVGRHAVTGEPDGRTRLTLTLEQSGALAGLVRLLLGARARRYVDLEAAGLKAAAESANR
jgi:uncharacterized protein YndB with AHSA1/START domain